MLKAITFDFWNTLYKPSPDLGISEKRVASLQNELNLAGYKLADGLVMEIVKQARDYAYDKQRQEGIDISPRSQVDFILEKLGIKIDQPEWEKLYQVYSQVLISLPPDLNDGVLDTLPLLARKYKLAVICNTGVTPGHILRDIMKKDQIFDFFQLTVFSDEMGWAKPNPQIFHYTLQALQVNPEEAAHIGDDSLTDIRGAKKAGMTSIWLAPLEDEVVSEADYHIRNVKELLQIL